MTKRKAKLQTKIQQLQAQLKDIERREKAAARKQDTRQKILIGAMMQKWIEQGQFQEEVLLKGLDKFLVRDSDRSLFGLPPKPDNEERPSPPRQTPKASMPSSMNTIDRSTIIQKVPTETTHTRLREVKEEKLAEEFL